MGEGPQPPAGASHGEVPVDRFRFQASRPLGNAGTLLTVMSDAIWRTVMSSRLPTLDELKAQARRLRNSLAEAGSDISHSKSLELIAKQYGFADWNTLHAKVGNQPPRRSWNPGDRVKGTYLGKAFEGTVLALKAATSVPGYYTITVDFDEPVDVVDFDSFSAFRKRVTATIDEEGISPSKTSNGRPHMVLTA